MKALDLTRRPPRRWTEQLGGIRWLPRLLDKTRAALAGTLGPYLYGQSPIDRALLRRLGIGYRQFTAIVAKAPDDAGVLAALQASTPQGLEDARAWSATLPRMHRAFLFVLDLDDGYLSGGWHLLKAPTNVVANAFTRWLKRRFPSRAVDP
ncbi:MAG: DUF5069 domain-containing protein [Candidatus Eremiobacteraeota bacterium]|nr:DUF5069 domain-containing protein [Candidatus Eremiobacteraeota bacterium]